MALPIGNFPVAELPRRIQTTVHQKRRKTPLDLEKCQLMELVQYQCDPEGSNPSNVVIKCTPLIRLFRRYARSIYHKQFRSDKGPG